jgi:CheY-like chemotaxis protein
LQQQPERRPQPSGPDAAARSNLVTFPRQNAGERGASARLRVLVVDDSPTVRRQLGLAFERLGLDCEAASSAAEALGMLDEGHFDLILVDVVMPDMDGYRLTREIKRNRRLRGLPVIILTSRSSPFDLARGALAGCDTYLTKPVPFRALEKAVVRQLRRSLAIDDLGSLVRSAAEPGAAEPSAPAGSQPLARVARLFGR